LTKRRRYSVGHCSSSFSK